MISLQQLLGPYAGEPWTEAEIADGIQTVRVWNELEAAAAVDGVPAVINPATGSAIGGAGNGGARPKGSKVGATRSKHQYLQALDRFDPARAFMRWVLSYGLERAAALGMYFEHPQWTRSWVHGQILPPGDGFHRWGIFFVPYQDLVKNPPTCIALPEQQLALVQAFPFKATA